ncbi:hypothetical protein WOLCODRAFT_144654 [Wolfiporia cocos MD-104 SS10]|uniref:Spindle pole body component n=1 Tax=Wolfiporia cocos (strain MD-104) TaxID=742152 RepID=A0A2H3JNH2_WOLCO|nr:hypothetical protein WOLCODRAFT_144654 [Wolfiporia cocos MD-104 SS10]
MSSIIHDLECSDISLPCTESLPDILPGFFIPRLTDKPQDPMMDTLNLLSDFEPRKNLLPQLPPELEALGDDIPEHNEAQCTVHNDVWTHIREHKSTIKYNGIMSWDTLRPSFNAKVTPSAFLSQQDRQTFASVRYHVRPPFQDPAVQLVYVTPRELLQSLQLSLTGTSSTIYVWDDHSEKFILRGLEVGKTGTIALTGTDEVVSSSLVQRFSTIGTLMRRLEIVASTLRTKHSRADSVLHAFAHALSSVLDHLRREIATVVFSDLASGPSPGEVAALTASWVHQAEAEDILKSLALLCCREEHMEPSDYSKLPTTPAELLSRIYKHLDDHLERRSSRILVAMLAYMLTICSQDYFQQICQSVGYISAGSPSFDPPVLRTSGRDPLELDTDIDRAEEEEIYDEDEVHEEPLPCFMQAEIAEVLPKARKSLKLLYQAQPDHHLLNSQANNPIIRWLWTTAEVSAAWNGRTIHYNGTNGADSLEDDLDAVEQRVYKDELKQFAIFDLPPGTSIPSNSTQSASDGVETVTLQQFLINFHSSLPSLTPSLSQLTSLVLSPLVHHIDSLSGALVSVFLSPTDQLNFCMHLTLLRGYLLLTSHAFKSRLEVALFSDSDERTQLTPSLRMKRHRHSRPSLAPHSRTSSGKSSKRWPVGLSASLMEGDTWPPGGADLSYHLRTVIVDTLEATLDQRDRDLRKGDAQERILQDAESRLGFAIRDLPAGTGQEKWLNPLSIESLDFLYMDYKPPKPLDVLIAPSILAKYHRVFAFNLRLMRVSNAIAALYRMTRTMSTPLFPTFSQSNKLLLHFRFVAQSFVTSLSSYVYDTAIGRNFDIFLDKLSGPGTNILRDFPDAFALTAYHSRVLDDILNACLLRSGQKKVGDLLRGCLELVLELALIAGDRQTGRLEEYQAVQPLEDLWDVFRRKMTTLIQVLRALVDRKSGSSRPPDDMRAAETILAHAEGTLTLNLRDLLVRLDVAEYWK